MEDSYNDILSEIRAEKSIQKVPSVQEISLPKTETETETDWYNTMMSQSKKAGEFIPDSEITEKKDLSWSDTLRERAKPSPAAETAAHLGYGMASWIPSKLSGLGQIGFQKLNNAIFGSEAKNIKRTPEEREMFRKGVYSPEKIREMAEQSEAVWQLLPPPESKEAKFVLEKVGEGLDWALTHFRVADEYYTKKGYPNLGYALRFMGEFIFFKAAHGFGVRTSAKLKKLRRKVTKKAPAVEVEKTLEEVFDEIGVPKEEVAPKGDELKRVTKSQKIKAHKIQREHGLSKAEYMEIAEKVSGETSIKDMNKAGANRFIEELKKGKEAVKVEPAKEVKIEEKKVPVERPAVEEKIAELKPEPSVKKPKLLIEEETDIDIPYRDRLEGKVQPEESIPPAKVPETIRLMDLDKEGQGLSYISELSKDARSAALGGQSTKKGKIVVHRAGQSEIRQGDFVTFSRKSADMYLEGAGKGAKIYTKEIALKELYSPNPNEALWLPKKVVEVPKFKNTEEAYTFGKKATPIQVEELKRLREVQHIKFESFRKEGKLQEALNEAVKGQFYDEALQMVKGTKQYEAFKKVEEVIEPIIEKPSVEEPKLTADMVVTDTIEGILERGFTHELDARNLFVLEVRRRAKLNDEQVQELFLRPEYVDYAMPKIDRAFEEGVSPKDIVELADRFADEVVSKVYPKPKLKEISTEIKPEPPSEAVISITDKLERKQLDELTKRIEGALEDPDIIRHPNIVRLKSLLDTSTKFLDELKREKVPDLKKIRTVEEQVNGTAVALDKTLEEFYINREIQSKRDMEPDPYLAAKSKRILEQEKIEITTSGKYKNETDVKKLIKERSDLIREMEVTDNFDITDRALKNLAMVEARFIELAKDGKELRPSEAVKTLISDDIRTAEDMGIYAEIKEMLGEKKKIGEIMKEIKQKAYYKEDLADFGYAEKDIREAIRAIKAEMGDEGAVKQIQDVLKREEKKVERITEAEEVKLPADIEQVDPEIGRPAGVKEDLTLAPKELDEVRMRYEQEQIPLKNEEGKILKSKVGAMTRMKELGRIGDLVKNSKGEGWLVKRTKEQRKEEVKAEEKEWEDILKEEELGDLGDEGLGERVDLDVDTVFDPLKGERGAITFHRKTVKELKHFVKKGYYTRNRIIRELRKRGASDEDILKVFPDASVRILNEGKESKWWKEGQDTLELLPRRTLPNKLKAPAVTRGEAHMIATMKDMPARLTAEHLSWENAIRTFEKLPPEVKETFYRSVKEGESLAFDGLQEVLIRSKKIRQSVPFHSHKRIGTHAIAQQPDGVAVLAQQGITKIPKLKSKELKAYDDLRTIYEEFFVSVNRARKAAGEKPFPPIDNYFTWIQDITYLSKVEGVGLFSNWRTIESKLAEIKKVPSFRFAKLRAGPEKPRKLNLNPFTVIDTYAKTATHYIEMAPRLAKLNELLTEKFGMAQNTPHAYNFIRHWLNYQAGKIPAWDIAHPTTRRAMQVLNSNIVYSLLTYNVRSALIQPAALASSYTLIGEYYMGVGTAQVLSLSKWKMAGKKSNVLNTRSPEVAIYEAMEATGKLPGQVKRKVAQIGITPLTSSDSVAARITWLGAYEQGLKKLKLSERDTINRADDIVTRTQASAAKSDVAPIQRTQLGKTITCLQTFVINHWGFLTKDVLGIKNADIKNPVMVKRVIRFILATTAMNALYEDGLGLNSPNPTPIRAYREMFEETADHKKAFARGVKEIAEYIPLWGGRLRYGSEVGGPVLSELLKLIENGDVDALIKLMGIPGSNQFFKMVRAHERGGTDIDIALGRYVEPKKKGITSPIDKIKGLTIESP